MDKPKLQTQAPAYDWFDCQTYIEEKYDVNLNAYPDNFWHWAVDYLEVRNESYIDMYWEEILEDDTPEWLEKIIKIFIKEFGTEARFWICW